MTYGLGRDHPVGQLLRVFAVHLDTLNLVVEDLPVSEAELPLKIDLNQGPAVGLLGLVELLPAEAASMLPVQEHVESPPDYLADSSTISVESKEMGEYPLDFRVIRSRLADHGLNVAAATATHALSPSASPSRCLMVSRLAAES